MNCVHYQLYLYLVVNGKTPTDRQWGLPLRQQLKEDSFIGNCTGSPLSLQRIVSFSMDSSWRMRAACKGMTRLFYSDQHRKARAVCANCSVRMECLAASIVEEDIEFPIWGIRAGMTASERLRYRRMLTR